MRLKNIINDLSSVNKYFLYLLLLVIMYSGCIREYSLLDTTFEKLKKNIESNLIINDIRGFSQDSLVFLLPGFKASYSKLQKEINSHQEIEALLDSKSIPIDRDFRDFMLLFAFQKYLNNEKIDLKEIEQDVVEVRKKIELRIAKEEASDKEKLLNIIHDNDLRWEAGDTISVLLQLSGDSEYKHVFYRHHSLADDYLMADDTLNLKGEILDKVYKKHRVPKSELKNPLNLVFELKILELSDTNVYSPDKLRIGDEFDLRLESYGRLIE